MANEEEIEKTIKTRRDLIDFFLLRSISPEDAVKYMLFLISEIHRSNNAKKETFLKYCELMYDITDVSYDIAKLYIDNNDKKY